MKLSNVIAAARLMRPLALLAYVCAGGSAANLHAAGSDPATPGTTNKMKITIASETFTATLEDSPTAAAFKAMLSLTVEMTELNGNEKYFDLPTKLPVAAAKPGTIQAGDLMLWQSNTLVLFYKSFRTSYSYTRIGRIDNASGLAAAVGSENVKVRFE
jgi:hypothetical protein